MRGGQLIIDLKNKNHTSGVAVNHPGIYNLIKSTRKPVRLCNLVIDGVEKRDANLYIFNSNGNSFNGGISYGDTDYTFTIADNDDVTFTKAV